MDIKLQKEVSSVTKDVIVFDLIVLAILLVTPAFNKSMLLGLLFGTIVLGVVDLTGSRAQHVFI